METPEIKRTYKAVLTFVDEQDLAQTIGADDAPFNLEDATRYELIRNILCGDNADAQEMREDYGIKTYKKLTRIYVEKSTWKSKRYIRAVDNNLVRLEDVPYLVRHDKYKLQTEDDKS